MRNDLGAFQIHLEALRSIVASRGGIDALGWPKLLKPSIVRSVSVVFRRRSTLKLSSIEEFWSYFCHQSCISNYMSPTRSPASNIPPPYPPVLEILTPGELLDSLPSGFRLLALQKRLRTNVVVLVSRVRDFHLPIWDDSPPPGPVANKHHKELGSCDDMNSPRVTTAAALQVVQYCQQLLTEPDLTTIERACCIGLLLVLLSGPSEEKFPKISTQEIQQYIRELMPVSLDELDTNAANVFAWAFLTIVTASVVSHQSAPSSTLDCEQGSCFLLEKAIAYLRHSNTLARARAIMRQFILTDACDQVLENAWQLKIRHQDRLKD
jgi:hypothetical protein